MADWKIIGLSGLINAVLTFLLILIFYPLLFIAPLISGFTAAYFSRGYEDYYQMDQRDAMVIGVLSGIIGALISGLMLVFGTSIVNLWSGFLNANLGDIGNFILAGYLIIQILVVVNMFFGALGGWIGYIIKN